jgi:hypothetical protein
MRVDADDDDECSFTLLVPLKEVYIMCMRFAFTYLALVLSVHLLI